MTTTIMMMKTKMTMMMMIMMMTNKGIKFYSGALAREPRACLCIRVFFLFFFSCPQIWNIEQEKDREKEKSGGRPAKLNEKKGDGDIEREIENKGVIFGGRTT